VNVDIDGAFEQSLNVLFKFQHGRLLKNKAESSKLKRERIYFEP